MNIMIGFFELRQAEKTFFQDKFGLEHYYSEKPIQQAPRNVLSDLDTACVFVGSTIDQEIIDELESCSHIATRSTGVDHIDKVAARDADISISHVPSYGPETIAEFTFALLLNVTRKVASAYHQLRSHGEYSLESFRGTDLHGKTIGVVGTGDIGSRVVKIADGFGMDIKAVDKQERSDLKNEYGLRYVDSFENILPDLDVLTLHVPLTEGTHHLVDEAALKKLPDTAYLINTARGELIDTKALAHALVNGNLAGAGLDVLAKEEKLREDQELNMNEITEESDELLADHKLINLDNAVVTPHMAFYTRESELQILETATKNIRSFQNSGEPIHSA